MKPEILCWTPVGLVARLALAAAALSLVSAVHAQTNVSPFYIYGQIVTGDERPFPISVSVALRCGTRILQAVQTDTQGHFELVLGEGIRANTDMSAANDSYGPPEIAYVNSRGNDKNSRPDLFNCQLEVSAAGYHSISKPIMSDSAEVGPLDVGSMVLAPIAAVQAGMVSITSLQVPSKARKEFEKGEDDLHKHRLASATPHFEKAVVDYDKYAAAWDELGRIYSYSQQTDKSFEAFAKAITADPKYVPPYVSLATLQLNAAEYQMALDTAGQALQLNPDISLASFIQAAANYNLNRLDAAEKSALDAEKRPHQNIPQLHLLLAEIYLRKQEDSNAAAEMRSYLKESPQGEFAGETKKRLDELQRSESNADNRRSDGSAASLHSPQSQE